MEPVRFQSPEEFEMHRVTISERLLLSGYRVREDGKVARVRRATLTSMLHRRLDAAAARTR